MELPIRMESSNALVLAKEVFTTGDLGIGLSAFSGDGYHGVTYATKERRDQVMESLWKHFEGYPITLTETFTTPAGNDRQETYIGWFTLPAK